MRNGITVKFLLVLFVVRLIRFALRETDFEETVVVTENRTSVRGMTVTFRTGKLHDEESFRDGRSSTLVLPELPKLVTDPINPVFLFLIHAIGKAIRVKKQSITPTRLGEPCFYNLS